MCLIGQMNQNLVGSIYGMSSMKIAHFVPIGYQTWPPHAILVSDRLISKKSSPLKLLSHMNRNLVGSIYMYGSSPRFLCRLTALYILLEPRDVREICIRKTADLLLQLWVSTFPCFVSIGFYFLSETNI